MILTKALLLVLLLCIAASAAYPQRSSPSPSSSQTVSPTPRSHPTIDYDIGDNHAIYSPAYFSGGRRTIAETQLGWGILGFGFLIIGLEVLVMLRLKKGWGTQSIRITGITLVLVSGLFLIVTGYSQEQIAPMIGLLGTIVGFLLGKTASPQDAEK